MPPAVDAIRETAPAKINLFLHVLGRRADGLHRLDSLVVFAEAADTIEVSAGAAGEGPGLTRTGPNAAGLPPPAEDLALRAAVATSRHFGRAADLRIRLDKRLPLAAGIGGGSADAAAVIRALARLWGENPEAPELRTLAAGLGADVPVCLVGRAARVGGVGENVVPLDGMPRLAAVLVNPNRPLPTADVFAAHAAAAHAGAPGRAFAHRPGMTADALIAALGATENDLTAAAVACAPAVAEALAALEGQAGCALARMSGSGATCFGLFADRGAARAAAAAIARNRPDWWAVETGLG